MKLKGAGIVVLVLISFTKTQEFPDYSTYYPYLFHVDEYGYLEKVVINPDNIDEEIKYCLRCEDYYKYPISYKIEIDTLQLVFYEYEITCMNLSYREFLSAVEGAADMWNDIVVDTDYTPFELSFAGLNIEIVDDATDWVRDVVPDIYAAGCTDIRIKGYSSSNRDYSIDEYSTKIYINGTPDFMVRYHWVYKENPDSS